MDRMSWKRREHTESMKTRRAFWFIWTRSASEAHPDEITPKFIRRFVENRSSGGLRPYYRLNRLVIPRGRNYAKCSWWKGRDCGVTRYPMSITFCTSYGFMQAERDR